ncbi:hypothetical protein [Tepidibacter aestuarii]|nr:hypothetical protein [Tepidibacter aestuarii]CAH2211901.1 protein of unknown function [Tepidibacter aestuarii]
MDKDQKLYVFDLRKDTCEFTVNNLELKDIYEKIDVNKVENKLTISEYDI